MVLASVFLEIMFIQAGRFPPVFPLFHRCASLRSCKSAGYGTAERPDALYFVVVAFAFLYGLINEFKLAGFLYDFIS